MVESPICEAHVFGCKLNYVRDFEIMKSFQEQVFENKKTQNLAANKGVSSKFLNAYIILSGRLPRRPWKLSLFRTLGNYYSHGKI